MARLILTFVGCCALAVVIGLMPVNRGFRNANSGVEIFVYADAVHSGVVVPLSNATIDWRRHFPVGHFRSPDAQADLVAFGWGDRKFFLETPRWSDLRADTAALAVVVPTRTAMHVQFRHRSKLTKRDRRVLLSQSQYERLIAHILESFRRDANGEFVWIAGSGYGDRDTFYEARNRYFFANTCNNWTGLALKRAGVCTGLWTPFAIGLAQVPQEAPRE
jgi:uncharacterized protein (TIGR02117 family)